MKRPIYAVFQSRPTSVAREQQGVVLIITLIVLLLVTLLAVAAIRMGIAQERMAGGTHDRNIAFQAAETALRQGEAFAAQQALPSSGPNGRFPDSNVAGKILGTYAPADPNNCPNAGSGNSPCNAGFCSQPEPACMPRWLDPDFDSWAIATLDQGPQTGEDQARFIVEFLGAEFPCFVIPEGESPGTFRQNSDPMNCKRYRITAVKNPGEGRSTVILQSVFAAE